jgi:TonB family protein
VLPPLEIEVVAGNTHGTFHLGNNPVKVELTPDSTSEASTEERGPATVATERVQMPIERTQNKVQSHPQPQEASYTYPLLGRQMKVQGSVLLQAFIGADGVIRDLRVLSGPAILASAAREAARRWQFKPYLQNGKPVETQATIAVNFTIKVLDNGARDQMDTVVALSLR